MKRTRAAAAFAATTLVATVASVGAWTITSAGAEDTLGSGLQSFSLAAVAGGQRIIADGIASQSPGTVDSGIPDAEATMTASTGHALSSVAWPSALAGNAGSLLFLLGAYPCTPSQYNSALPVPPVDSVCSPAPVPDDVMAQYHYLNSPLRAEASAPVKPTDDMAVPGGTMTARAEDGRSFADAILGAAFTNDIEKFASARATSTVKLTGVASAVADAASVTTGIEFAGGEITIGSISSFAHAETVGSAAKSNGSTTISNMKVHGIPVTVDGAGVHVNGQTADAVGPTAQVVNNILTNFGMTMFTTRPTPDSDGGTASFSAESLVIEWLGDPGCIAAPKTAASCGVIFEFGGAHATAAASLPFAFDDSAFAGDAGSAVDSSFSDAGSALGATSDFGTGVLGDTVTPLGGSGSRRTPGGALVAQPAVAVGNLPHGVSAWWMVLGLIAVASLAAGLRQLPDRILAAGGSTCGDEA